jgi:hypothetical protein
MQAPHQETLHPPWHKMVGRPALVKKRKFTSMSYNSMLWDKIVL